jgi:hypothetical protein
MQKIQIEKRKNAEMPKLPTPGENGIFTSKANTSRKLEMPSKRLDHGISLHSSRNRMPALQSERRKALAKGSFYKATQQLQKQ